MGKIAFVFSGQGDQYAGMGRSLSERYPAAARVFAACDRLRPGTSAQCFAGSEEELKETKNTQPCLFAYELALAAVLEEQGVRADLTAGFSLGEVDPGQVEWLEFSMEISSNAPLYREDWKSDISVQVNGCTLGTWVSPGDYGGRRGRLNPSWWSETASQYGLLKTWRVDGEGSTLDGEAISGTRLEDLRLSCGDYISLRVGVDAHAEHVGGMNLFGEKFGDYAQGIVMRVGYGAAQTAVMASG